MKLLVRPLEKSDKKWIVDFINKNWHSIKIVARGKIYYADKLPGFIALKDNQPVGLITYHIDNNECEIITLNVTDEKIGIGTALIDAVKQKATNLGCKRLLCITTNDNLQALRFYQKRGFTISAVYPNALEKSRKLKPEIPLIGKDGIPIRDEIKLEMSL